MIDLRVLFFNDDLFAIVRFYVVLSCRVPNFQSAQSKVGDIVQYYTTRSLTNSWRNWVGHLPTW